MFVPEDLLNGRLNLATGSHKVTVRAWDALGSFSKTVSVNVTACGSTAPERSVSICTPLGGTVHNPVRIRAVVKDSAYVVSSLQIYVDGVKKFSVAARELDTTLTLAVGRRRIAVKAFDEISSFTTVVYVTVQ
jgi:hypothetical protein